MLDIGTDNMKSIIFTIIAGFGGALGYVYRETRAGKRIKLFRVALSALLVAFVCFHLGLLYTEWGFSDRTVWALNGFTSVLGVEFIMNLAKIAIFKKLGITDDDVLNERLIRDGWTPPPGSDNRGINVSSESSEPATTK